MSTKPYKTKTADTQLFCSSLETEDLSRVKDYHLGKERGKIKLSSHFIKAL